MNRSSQQAYQEENMSKFANVVYAYSPNNDDELKLQVGDRIELLGPEEEGWWKGRLNGRIGVFPSNFVQVIESDPTAIPRPIIPSSPSQATISPPVPNKLNIFSSAPSKSSLAALSLNSNNSNSNNNNNNSTMNNTRQQDDSGSAFSDGAQSMTSIERRPKPIRGTGFGDIFASGPKQARQPSTDVTTNSLPNERLNTSITDTLQKQIPKKPPPPAPILHNSNGSSSVEQAPALPPKPNNHFSPLGLQHHKPFQHLLKHNQPMQPVVREKARVIYSYEPTNDDELTIEVGDIIDVIEKDIEDAGWWKGELRGKIGVFPDNFVELIETPPVDNPATSSHLAAAISNASSPSTVEPKKIKSVFAATPKGFSKELENNLEKHNNGPASFLSLKRNNKLQQQVTPPTSGASETASMNGNDVQESEAIKPSTDQTNTIKLNHITANRAKGPTRKPPSNVLLKRNQLMDQIKRESNGKDEPPSLPTIAPAASAIAAVAASAAAIADTTSLPPPQHSTPVNIVPAPIKPSLSLENVIETPKFTPETSQRMTRVAALDKTKETPTTNTTTPHWMVELKKAHAERKRDTPLSTQPQDEAPTSVIGRSTETQASINEFTTPMSQVTHPLMDRKPAALQSLKGVSHSITQTNAQVGDNVTAELNKNDMKGEISELRRRVERLEKETQEINELKSTLETMKIELKACQSATDNQRKYIKELVNNLADERKKIAAMQVEIDRNLK